MISAYSHYINHQHPVYKGIHALDGTRVSVALNSWSDEIKLGSGEVHFDQDDSSTEPMLPFPCCFILRRDLVSFINDDYCESTFIAFRISDDFKSLTLVDKITEKSLKILVVKQVHAESIYKNLKP